MELTPHLVTQRRILLISRSPAPTRTLLKGSRLADWDVVTTDSSPAAALYLQSNACDVILADASHFQAEGVDGVTWLAQKETTPVVLLSDGGTEWVSDALERGLSIWLPLGQVLRQPDLLAAALERAASWNDLFRSHRRTREALDASQRQVDRLVSLLWRTAPMQIEKRWYTHRHMLERLEEELACLDRHQHPLTVALGELQADPVAHAAHDHPELFDWAAEQIVRGKRRNDVVGQYGVDGFMLLLAHTSTAGGVCCCRRIQLNLERAGVEGRPRWPTRSYFGLATTSEKTTAQSLLRRAEENLEAAKCSNRERLIAG